GASTGLESSRVLYRSSGTCQPGSGCTAAGHITGLNNAQTGNGPIYPNDLMAVYGTGFDYPNNAEVFINGGSIGFFATGNGGSYQIGRASCRGRVWEGG